MPDETNGAAFRAALADAADALASLPRRRAATAEARERVARLAAAHPGARIDVAVDLRPGAESADYDLLLEHPAGGTLALSYRPDAGNPWFVDYADHWAANLVVSVGDASVSVQQALTLLELRADESPGLLDELVDAALAEEAMAVERPAVTREEIQAAADAFRAARGLRSAAATRAWLARMGWTEALFSSLIANATRFRALKERIAAPDLEAFIADHGGALDLVRIARAETDAADLAGRLASEAADGGLIAAAARAAAEPPARVSFSVAAVRAHELPPQLEGAAPGRVTGPHSAGDRYWVAQVVARQPAPPGAATRAAARDLLFRRWADARRDARGVRWHWL